MSARVFLKNRLFTECLSRPKYSPQSALKPALDIRKSCIDTLFRCIETCIDLVKDRAIYSSYAAVSIVVVAIIAIIISSVGVCSCTCGCCSACSGTCSRIRARAVHKVIHVKHDRVVGVSCGVEINHCMSKVYRDERTCIVVAIQCNRCELESSEVEARRRCALRYGDH